MRRKAAATNTVTHDGSGKSSTTPPLFASRSSMSKNGTAAAFNRKGSSSSRPPTPAMQSSPSQCRHTKKPLMPLLRRHRSAGSATSDVTRETLAETSSTVSSAAPLYGNSNSGCSTSSGVNSMSQQYGAARSVASRRPSATSTSSSCNSYYYSSAAAAASHFQYSPCETEQQEHADDDRSIRTGPIDVDEMVPLVDVPSPPKLSRRVACPIDLDDVESELLLSDEDDDDDSSNAIFILEGDDLDEEDFDQRLMGYVFTFEPEVIYELPPPLPLNNYAARRKFSHEAIPQSIHERKSSNSAAQPSSSFAWNTVAGPASLSVQSKRTGTLTSSSGASQMSVSICHNCGGRNGECLGNKFCI
ncbi:hypothetical protein MPSEU_000826100 [Mayamaea pseudoterrestris]|nr:hypothetical protein MPSEU_000826100 [Mayamaea pseudoterrestris]